jgi:hypothetical protein
MSLKSLIYNLFYRLRGETSEQNTSEHRSEYPLTPNESPISPPVATPKRNVGGRPSVDFNLVEACGCVTWDGAIGRSPEK